MGKPQFHLPYLVLSRDAAEAVARAERAAAADRRTEFTPTDLLLAIFQQPTAALQKLCVASGTTPAAAGTIFATPADSASQRTAPRTGFWNRRARSTPDRTCVLLMGRARIEALRCGSRSVACHHIVIAAAAAELAGTPALSRIFGAPEELRELVWNAP